MSMYCDGWQPCSSGGVFQTISGVTTVLSSQPGLSGTGCNGLVLKTLFIEPGSPWENRYIESFNGKLRDELLNREVFDTLLEAKVLVGRWL